MRKVLTKLQVVSPDVGGQNPSGVSAPPAGADAVTASHSTAMSPYRVRSDLGF